MNIGQKIGAIRREYYRGDVIYACWHPRVQVDGVMMNVGNNNGTIECETRKEALEYAKKVRDKMNSRADDGGVRG